MNPTANLRKIENAFYIHESKLESNPFQPREYFAPGPMEELRLDIQFNGVQQPILARIHPDPKKATLGFFQICSGERRVRASRGAGPDRQEVPAIVENLSDLQMRERALQENIQRATLTDFEEAKALKALWDLYEQQGSTMSIREMARRMSVAPGYVSKRLDALGFNPEVVDLLSTHRGVLSSATVINEVDDPDKRAELIEKVEEGVGFRAIKKEVDDYQEEKKSQEEVNHAPDQETEQRAKLAGQGGKLGGSSRGHTLTGGPQAQDARRQVVGAVLQIDAWAKHMSQADFDEVLGKLADRIKDGSIRKKG